MLFLLLSPVRLSLLSLYVVFLFVEQHFFKQKMHALFSNKNNRRLVDNILNHIAKDTQRYWVSKQC